ncbi:hypothetical protein K493DRAFT_321678 [Basidiobolus meristosporus CBS 931.73]|uniref:Uncharacterized protein n=1 Tax=Basidiobolus meristosporus CBS 931.73 TaxID=1314790 RepID=A0A1Y1WQP2_9FUNG|nr:hypothetical protein K493DRAFT_321678 [Basidiobolus meristosporus CBS 931.73]|eukprot:ORX75586.1 hypothetical protein K493DRAFT_321678 [Basidiobolus meristosporus CBS 931.73]
MRRLQSKMLCVINVFRLIVHHAALCNLTLLYLRDVWWVIMWGNPNVTWKPQRINQQSMDEVIMSPPLYGPYSPNKSTWRILEIRSQILLDLAF